MDKEIHNDEDVFDSRDVLDYIKINPTCSPQNNYPL